MKRKWIGIVLFLCVAMTGTFGQVATMPFSENFESGVLSNYWASTGTATYRTQVTSSYTPHGGSYHLTMDSSVDSSYSRNELTLSIDLANYENVELSFWAKEFVDEPNGPPASPFFNNADFDGVAISEDGVSWYEVQPLRSEITSGYAQFIVALDAAVATHGLAYNSNFKIRFNHYDNFMLTTDGFAFDDISVTGNIAGPQLSISLTNDVTEGTASISGSVSIDIAPSSNQVINLVSDNPAELTVQSNVTILAGATNASFAAYPGDDSELDGSQPVTITATAPTYINGQASITVHDDETATLILSIPANTTEGVGSVDCSVMLSSAPADNVTVAISSSNTGEVQSTSTVIPVGLNIALFSLPIVDDNLIDGAQAVTVTAHVSNWVDGVASITVNDNESTSLTVDIPSTAVEGDGVLTNAGTVSVQGVVIVDTLVTLSSFDPSEVTVPASTTITQGQSSATFDITVIDDSDEDGNQSASIVASASGFISNLDSITVADDDLHYFDFGTISTQQTAGVGFPLQIDAKTIDGIAINYSGPASMSAIGNSGSLAMTPTALTFTNGQWNGDVSINAIDSGVSLLVDDGLGHTGTSSVFNVDGPIISITPAALTNTVAVADDFVVRTMVVSNAGTVDLAFAVDGAVAGIDTNLILHYTFDNDSGTNIVDQSGNGNDGILMNNCTYTNGMAGQGLQTHGDSAEFGSAGGHVLLPAIDFNSMGELTVAFWIKEETMHHPHGESYISIGTYDTGVAPIEVRNSTMGDAILYMVDPNIIANPYTDPMPIEFVHHAITYSNGMVYAYRNGGLIGQTNGVINVDSQYAALARHWWGGAIHTSTRLTAVFDEVRVYDRCLSDVEIVDLYNASSASHIATAYNESGVGSETNLMAYYPFNGNAADEAGNGYNGTVNGATLTTDRFGNIDSAYSFDGVNDYIRIGSEPDIPSWTNSTVSVWFLNDGGGTQDSVGYGQKIFDKTSISHDFYLSTTTRNSGSLWFQLYEGRRSYFDDDTQDYRDGIWHHAVITKNTNIVTVWVDGVEMGSTNDAMEVFSSSDLLFGTSESSDFRQRQYWSGKIDDVRIYQRALSASEIVGLYQEADPRGNSWIWANPKSGTVEPGASSTIYVGFYADNMRAGDYVEDEIEIMSNDVLSPTNIVPVSMWVAPPAPVMLREPDFTEGTSNEVFWSEVGGPVTYLVEVATSMTGAPSQQASGLIATNHLFSGLSTNTIYYYHVKASVPSGLGPLDSEWSDWESSVQAADLSDYDGDGLPNWWEWGYFGNNTNSNPLVDDDGDGYNNMEEYIAWTDPTLSGSYFVIDDWRSLNNNHFVVQWSSATGRVYSVFWTDNLTNSFQLLESNIPYPQESFTDSVHSAESAGFYSVDVQLDD